MSINFRNSSIAAILRIYSYIYTESFIPCTLQLIILFFFFLLRIHLESIFFTIVPVPSVCTFFRDNITFTCFTRTIFFFMSQSFTRGRLLIINRRCFVLCARHDGIIILCILIRFGRLCRSKKIRLGGSPSGKKK